MRITVIESELNFVKPADASLWQGGNGMREYWDQLRRRNGDDLENVRRAHRELKDLLALAVDTARDRRIALARIEVVCPQLLTPSSWGGYFGSPWDPRCCSIAIREWFFQKYGERNTFYVNGQPEIDGQRCPMNVLIDFSKKDVKKHNYWFQA